MFIIEPIEVRYMGRTGVWTITVIILLASCLSLMIIVEAGDDPVSGQIISIDGDSELSMSAYLKCGSGSRSDPYVLTGFPSDTVGLEIRNISSWIEVRDSNISMPSEVLSIDIGWIKGCILENVTISDHDHIIRAVGKMDLMINNTSFNDIPAYYNPSSTFNAIFVEINGRLAISNSTFMTRTNGTSMNIRSYIEASRISISNCEIAGYYYQVRAEDRHVTISNCTFGNGIWLQPRVIGGSPYHVIISNNFFNDSFLDTSFSYRIEILNNTFLGLGSYIHFVEDRADLWGWRNIVKGNIFEKSSGLWTEGLYNYANYITNWTITENYFGNCSNGGILWRVPKARNIEIWKNVFYHNRGTGDSHNGGPQIQFSIAEWASVNYNWSKNGMGNYWADWTGPDDDGNGIVDHVYRFSESGGYSGPHNDSYPVTNRYFDITRPVIRITHPEGPVIDHNMEYIKLEWEAWDDLSGLDRVLFSMDRENWTDVTEEDWWPVKLVSQEQEVFLKAYDRSGLFNITSKTITLGTVTGPIALISPSSGEIVLKDEVSIIWSVDEYFPMADQSLKMDSEEVEVRLDDRSKVLELGDGSHLVELTCRDIKDCEFTKIADFIVDTNPPEINVSAPYDGAVYSNEFVNFHWTVHDVNGLVNVRYRLDGGEWVIPYEKVEHTFVRLMDKEDHLLEIEAVDIAGRVSVESVNFSIGPGTLEITSPEDGFVTAENQVILRWRIANGFVPSRVELEYLEKGSKISVMGTFERIEHMILGDRHRFKITAADEQGNRASDTVTVYWDMEDPLIRILNEEEVVNDRPLLIRWAGSDPYGISHYSYRLDEGEWINTGMNTSLELSELSEGLHSFDVLCVDIVGNSASDIYEFVYDTTSPEVTFSNQDDKNISQDALVSFRWSVSDENGLSGLSLSIGDAKYDLPVKKTFWEGIVDDGSIEVTISATDTAGNEANDSIIVIVDTMDPILEWSDDLTSPTGLERISMGWNAADNLGLSDVILTEDGEEIWSGEGTGPGSIDLTPDEGTHSYSLTAFDLSDRTTTIERTIVVDRTAPVIDLFIVGRNGDIFIVEWSVFDEMTSVEKVNITVGNISFRSEIPEHSWSFEKLEPGTYSVRITAVDETGNTIEDSKVIEIEDTSGQGGFGGGGYAWIWILLSVIVLGLASAIFVFIYMKRKKAEEEDVIPEEVSSARPRAPTLPPSAKPAMIGGFKAAPRLNPASLSEISEADNRERPATQPPRISER